jgi:hypothetical protein
VGVDSKERTDIIELLFSTEGIVNADDTIRLVAFGNASVIAFVMAFSSSDPNSMSFGIRSSRLFIFISVDK